jgi:RNA polymerase sigma-70 factor (ECF subfamily)
VDTTGIEPNRGEELRPGLFPETQWNLVLRARRANGAATPACDDALAQLLHTYREPLRLFLQQHYPGDTVEDRLQEFLLRMASRDFLDHVHPSNGRFRSYLLTCLKNSVRTELRRSLAQKRGGGVVQISLDEADAEGGSGLEPVDETAQPDLEFDRAWARSLLERAIARLGQECAAAGKSRLFDAAHPALTGEPEPGAYALMALTTRLTEGALKVAIFRLRRRLALIVRDEVRKTLLESGQVEDELRYLIGLFST